MRVIFSYNKNIELPCSKQIEMTEIQYKKISENFPKEKHCFGCDSFTLNTEFRKNLDKPIKIVNTPYFLNQLILAKSKIREGAYIMPCEALIDLCQTAINEKGQISMCLSNKNIQYPIR